MVANRKDSPFWAIFQMLIRRHISFVEYQMRIRSLVLVFMNIVLINDNIISLTTQNIMDGDLCEQFTSLDPAKQKTIAADLGRTPNEVAKKLEDIRTRYAF